MKQSKPFSAQKIVFYFLIIFFIGYFFTKNTLDFGQLLSLKWTGLMGQGIALAAVMLILRDLGYVLRLRLLCDYKIGFWKSVKIILLWEFGSAITPGMIGGKAVAIYLLIKNKISAAKASSIVLIAILLDEFIFILLFPVFYFLFGKQMFHLGTQCPDWLALKAKIPWIESIKYLEYTVILMLIFILVFVGIVFVGIFIYPSWIRQFIKTIARLPLLKKWRTRMDDFADEIHHTSIHIRSKKFRFWLQLCVYTLMSWVGRYLVGVAIVYGFSSGQIDWLYVYVKQYALWLMFYLPSTPGSSGIAEALYMAFYCDSILPGLSGTAAFVWRFMSYYIYLFIGVLVLIFSRDRDMVEKT
ncbi:MAG: flippase-like domain-containing protein [Chitinophagales bacterium]|nr:flippase-like domain-containing protein [Chitinophagales bacterium]